MYVRDLEIGDVVEVTEENKTLDYYRVAQEEEEILEAKRCGFTIGYIRHYRGSKDSSRMIYLGPVRTKVPVAGLYKHHLFLTPDGTYGIEGYDFRFLQKVVD